MVIKSYRGDGKIKMYGWDQDLADFAKFIIKHPHLGPRLTREHLKQLLEVTTLSQSVACTMVETVFIHDTQLPALQTSVDESFFKLVAASLTYDDYANLHCSERFPSVPLAYVRKRFSGNCLIQDKIIAEKYPLQNLIALAKKDGRIALILFATPELRQTIPMPNLMELAVQDMQAKEEHWGRPSFNLGNENHYLNQTVCPQNSPVLTHYFTDLMWVLLSSEALSLTFLRQFKQIEFEGVHQAPATWKNGYRLYLIKLQRYDSSTFTLPLCYWQYVEVYPQFKQYSYEGGIVILPLPETIRQIPTLQALEQAQRNKRENAASVTTANLTMSQKAAALMVSLNTDTPQRLINETSQQKVPDSTVSPAHPVVSGTRTEAPDNVINTASQEVSSTSWGSILAWVLSVVLTTVGIGLLVLGTILPATYMMPLVVCGFISLASGLVLGLELFARQKTTYEMKTRVDNYEAVRPTLDTEPRLHEEAIVYEALNISEVSRHAQLPVKYSMQPTQNLLPSTEETSVMEHLV